MPLTVDEIITDRVRVLLRDTDAGGVQWTDAELIAWFNDGCNEIARMRPESSSTTEEVALAAGAKQAIPAGGELLLEVICNGSNGRAVRSMDRHTIDNEIPNWMNGSQTSEAYRYIASLTDPRTFYVYPPSNGSGHNLTIVYSSAPAEVTQLVDNIPLPDLYGPVLVNYICYRAFQKMSESAEYQTRAADFLTLFNNQMGTREESMEGRNSKVRQPSIPQRM